MRVSPPKGRKPLSTAELVAREEAKKIAARKKAANERRAQKRAERKETKRVAAAASIENVPPAVRPQDLGVPHHVAAGKVAPSKVRMARENLSQAFDDMGGVPALVKWGKANPTEFYRIWARLIPKEAVEETSRLPLEDLLARLAAKADESVQAAATAIGQEVLAKAKKKVSLEDAQAALFATEETTLQ